MFLSKTQFEILRLYSVEKNVDEIATELLNGVSVEEIELVEVKKNIGAVVEHFKELGLVLDRNVCETGEYRKFYPKTLNIELTDRCNFYCSHCYKEAASNNKDSLNIEKIKEILSSFKGKIAVLNLTGGEPLLYPGFKEIIRSFGKDYFINVTTNGSLIKNLSLEDIKLVNNFQISLYGINEESYVNVINKSGMYKNVKESLELLSEQGIPFTVAVILNKEVCRDISLYKEMIEKTSASYVLFSKVGRAGRSNDDDDFWNVTEEMESELQAYVIKNFKIETNLKSLNEKKIEFLKHRNGCTAGKLQLTISEKGELVLCNTIDHNFFSLGECDILYSYVEKACDCEQIKSMMESYKKKYDCRNHICPLLREK